MWEVLASQSHGQDTILREIVWTSLEMGSGPFPSGTRDSLPWGLRPESLLRYAAVLTPHQVILSHQAQDMKSSSV